ncbi:MAG: hypothetical protein DRH08_00630 [Deltaproteobacteria bacterium]|nr:MAG: hypothetical protein DRH08_00630 [Deltaproteobacteria bacterium]
MSMTQAGDRMNRPQTPPDPNPWQECEWDDCLTMVHEDDEGAPFCWTHYREQLSEEAAETANKMAKEDF